MIETLARVVAIEGGTVTVEASQSSACDGCHNKDCGTGSVNQALGRKTHQMSLSCDKPVKLGDQVVLAIPEQGLVLASLLVYMLPLLCVIGTLLIVDPLFSQQADAELGLIIVSLIAGISGFMLAGRWASRLQAKQLLEPQVVRVIGQPLRVESTEK